MAISVSKMGVVDFLKAKRIGRITRSAKGGISDPALLKTGKCGPTTRVGPYDYNFANKMKLKL
ncbi:MAG: hypothetical protein CVT49_08905 [candidate division Zixibacteria bacterium HGW-Zixibacteria-1]|nr:MAG: hypothetical protein CVT49_08905 [candidate division Zixibacteria bacterium HGW-Zixibacteria-1]